MRCRELAGVVQQLAAAEGERKELADRVADLRDDLARLRTGRGKLFLKRCRCCCFWAWGWAVYAFMLAVPAVHLLQRQGAQSGSCASPAGPATPKQPSPRLCHAGDEGELRVRIEKLEKELIVTRNARDVNALFKTEHDRWSLGLGGRVAGGRRAAPWVAEGLG